MVRDYDLKVLLAGVLLIFIGFIFLVISHFSGATVEIPEIIRDIGIALAPVGLITLIYEFFLRDEFFKSIQKMILKSAEVIHNDRTDIDFLEFINSATKKVCILDTSLNYFYAKAGFPKTIEESLKRGCDFHFLALDPYSNLAKSRAQDAGKPNFGDEIQESIDDFCRFKSKMEKNNYKGKIIIKKYSAIPTCMLFIVENKIIKGSILQKRRGRDSMHVIINKKENKDAYDQLNNHFDDIWNDKNTKHCCIHINLKWVTKGDKSDEREITIVVDILRASTTITTLLEYGAEYIIPTIAIEEARELAKKDDALLIGERNAVIIKDFNFGNSPAKIPENKVKGKKIIFTSTNFPKAIEAAKRSPIILVGSMLNLSAVTHLAQKLAEEKGYNICYMLAGNLNNSADEDLAFVGESGTLLKNLLKNCFFSNNIKSAIDVIDKKGAKNMIEKSIHAKNLIELGFKEDVEFSIEKDKCDIVPIVKNNKIEIYTSILL